MTFNPDYKLCDKCNNVVRDIIKEYTDCYGELEAENTRYKKALNDALAETYLHPAIHTKDIRIIIRDALGDARIYKKPKKLEE